MLHAFLRARFSVIQPFNEISADTSRRILESSPRGWKSAFHPPTSSNVSGLLTRRVKSRENLAPLRARKFRAPKMQKNSIRGNFRAPPTVPLSTNLPVQLCTLVDNYRVNIDTFSSFKPPASILLSFFSFFPRRREENSSLKNTWFDRVDLS